MTRLHKINISRHISTFFSVSRTPRLQSPEHFLNAFFSIAIRDTDAYNRIFIAGCILKTDETWSSHCTIVVVGRNSLYEAKFLPFIGGDRRRCILHIVLLFGFRSRLPLFIFTMGSFPIFSSLLSFHSFRLQTFARISLTRLHSCVRERAKCRRKFSTENTYVIVVASRDLKFNSTQFNSYKYRWDCRRFQHNFYSRPSCIFYHFTQEKCTDHNNVLKADWIVSRSRVESSRVASSDEGRGLSLSHEKWRIRNKCINDDAMYTSHTFERTQHRVYLHAHVLLAVRPVVFVSLASSTEPKLHTHTYTLTSVFILTCLLFACAWVSAPQRDKIEVLNDNEVHFVPQ